MHRSLNWVAANGRNWRGNDVGIDPRTGGDFIRKSGWPRTGVIGAGNDAAEAILAWGISFGKQSWVAAVPFSTI